MKNEIRCSVEIREDETRQSPGRLTGTLIEYETKATDRSEIFARDSLKCAEAGIVLNLSHDRKQPVVRFTPEVRANAVMVDVELPDTSRGRDAATMVRNKTLMGLSIEFIPVKDDFKNGVREIRQARLTAAALVDSAAYGNSIEVRGESTNNHRRKIWL